MDPQALSRWCDARRATYAAWGDRQWVEIADPRRLRPIERAAVADRCARFNFACYRFACARTDPDALSAFAGAMGLIHRDPTLGADHRGIASVQVQDDVDGPELIPFTARALNWHTDGYYNPPERAVHGVVMHCAAPAVSGGETTLLDPDLVCAALHERDPAFIEALIHPKAMTIPAYVVDGAIRRLERSGPVFSFRGDPPRLHMRYTARTRSIHWRPGVTTTAVTALGAMIVMLSSYHVRVRFEVGEGVICNNVLHRRAAFVDRGDARRRLLRIRSFDAISK